MQITSPGTLPIVGEISRVLYFLGRAIIVKNRVHTYVSDFFFNRKSNVSRRTNLAYDSSVAIAFAVFKF